MMRRVQASMFAMAAVLLVLAPPLHSSAKATDAAQPKAEPAAAPPPEAAPKNLKVLPKDWSRKQVIEFMKGWTGDLGVRCQHCHVGEEGLPFEKWDFPSDEKPTKRRAREMFQMLEEINARLGKMSNLHQPDAMVPAATCGTCHHGLARPRRVEDVFEDTRATKGIAAAIDEYRALRTELLVRGQYDFSIRPLATQARRQLQNGDAEGAAQVMALALELGLDGLMARMTLVDIALAQEDKPAAIAHLDKALTLELNPGEKQFVTQRRAQLMATEAPPPN